MDLYRKQHNFLLLQHAQWPMDTAVEVGTVYRVDARLHRFAALGSNGSWAYGVKSSSVHGDDVNTSLCRQAMEFRAILLGLELNAHADVVLQVSGDVLTKLQDWGSGTTTLPRLHPGCGFSRTRDRTYAQVARDALLSHRGGISASLATPRQLCVAAAEEIIEICSKFRFTGSLGLSYESREKVTTDQWEIYRAVRDGYLTYKVNSFLDLLWPHFTPGRRVRKSFASTSRVPRQTAV